MIFPGQVFDRSLDESRLTKQFEIIRDLMLDGQFRTLQEIEDLTGFPQASISAQLRHLKKIRYGNFRVYKKRTQPTGGCWKYQVLPPLERFSQMEFTL